LPIEEVRLAAGAGFIVALCGDINTMPGLPRLPAANRIDVDASGAIIGLA
jgi:formate--tetrahydrofolate ligase